MTRPQLNERHLARTYRSVSYPATAWTVQAAGGSVANGYITLGPGESVGMAWVPPYDLDPSKDIKFRYLYLLSSPTLRTFAATVGITFNAAGTLAAGTQLTHGGKTYTLDAEVTAVGAGVEAGAVTAAEAGLASDLAPLDALTLVTPNAAVDAIAVNVVTQAGVDEAEVEVKIWCNISPNDGSAVGYEFDPSTFTEITTPIGPFTPSVSVASRTQSSPTGSLTLADTTNRNWSAGLYLVGVGASVSLLALEVAYVPLTGGILNAAASISDPWV